MQLDWLLVCFQAQLTGLILTLKTLYSLGPGYLRNFLLPEDQLYMLNPVEVRVVPFFMVAPLLWNFLPVELWPMLPMLAFWWGHNIFLFHCVLALQISFMFEFCLRVGLHPQCYIHEPQYKWGTFHEDSIVQNFCCFSLGSRHFHQKSWEVTEWQLLGNATRRSPSMQ